VSFAGYRGSKLRARAEGGCRIQVLLQNALVGVSYDGL